MKTENEIREYLAGSGKHLADRFVEHYQKGDLIVVIKKPFNGRSVNLSVNSLEGLYPLCYNFFCKNLGCSLDRSGNVVVRGGGEDLTLALIDFVTRKLQAAGYPVEPDGTRHFVIL